MSVPASLYVTIHNPIFIFVNVVFDKSMERFPNFIYVPGTYKACPGQLSKVDGVINLLSFLPMIHIFVEARGMGIVVFIRYTGLACLSSVVTPAPPPRPPARGG